MKLSSSPKNMETEPRSSNHSSRYNSKNVSYDKENRALSHHTSVDSRDFRKDVDLSGLRDSLLPEDEEPDLIPTKRNTSVISKT